MKLYRNELKAKQNKTHTKKRFISKTVNNIKMTHTNTH